MKSSASPRKLARQQSIVDEITETFLLFSQDTGKNIIRLRSY